MKGQTSMWTKNNRWYRIDMGIDLLGDAIITRSWGSMTKHGGQSQMKIIASTVAMKEFHRAESRRRSRGYVCND